MTDLLIKGPGELRRRTRRASWPSRRRCSTWTRTSKTFGRDDRPGLPARRRRPRAAADVGLARSVMPPGTAATRDFSRLAPGSRSSSPSAASAAWPASTPVRTRAILGTVVPASAARARDRDIRRADGRPRAVNGDGPRPLRRHAEVRRRARAPGPRAGVPSGSSSTRSTARAAASASRSAPRSGTTR